MKKSLFLLMLAALFLNACSKDEDKEDTGDPLTELNKGLQLPAGYYTIDGNTQTDSTVIITSGGSGTMPLNTGSQMEGKISFNAPNGNVVGAGMRFGTSGPINVIPVSGAQGQTSGTLNVPFSLSPSTCANLSEICHDIKCYEFAITADGKISQANIRDVALMCGNCNEPSCRSLIVPPCTNIEAGTGFFNSSVASGSGTILCALYADLLAIEASGWEVVINNPGTTGSVSFDPDFFTNGCSSCPSLLLFKSGGASYGAVSGSGTWSGNVFSFTATLKHDDDIGGPGGATYTISGALHCK